MKTSRVFIVAVVVTLATLGSLIQHQFAQREQASKSQAVSDDTRDPDKAQRFDLDGLEFERKLVKGEPFSATLTVETTQADGSARPRTMTSLIFRDTEGRTRRDRLPQTPAAPNINPQPQNSTINDPVAGFTYALEHGSRIYRRGVFRSWSQSGADDVKLVMALPLSPNGQTRNSQMLPTRMNTDNGRPLKGGTIIASSSEIKNEQLGEREIEGVKAEGTRISTTIPAGAIGNEQPLEITVERWYSPELQTPVLIKRSDPRFGDIVFRLKDIKTGEQSKDLFVVPGSYKLSLDK
jgi:hypothetical protein